MTQIEIDRPPRIQPDLPFDEIEIPNPPQPEQGERFARLIQVGLPLITIIGYVMIGAMGGVGRNPWFLLPMALSVVASVAFSVYSYRQERQRQIEQEKEYAATLVDLNKEMNIYHDRQRRFYRFNYLDQPAVFQLVETAHMEAKKEKRGLRSETRLWERRVTDQDFGVVRLGMGTLPSTVIYTLNQGHNLQHPLARQAVKLADDSLFVSDIPVILSFRIPPEEPDAVTQDKEKERWANLTPVTHALGIAGDKTAVHEFVQAMLAHYTVFHAPQDARLYILALRQGEWGWTDSLPHCQANEQGQLRCFVEDNKAKVTPSDDEEEDELERFLEGLRRVLAQRKIRLQDRDENKGQGDVTLPLLLVVVDLLEAYSNLAFADNDSAKKEQLKNLPKRLQADAAISILLAEGQQLGATVIFLVPERSRVPDGCKSVIEIEKTIPASNSKNKDEQALQVLHFRYAEVGVNSFRYVGQADFVTGPKKMNELATQLAPLKIRESFGGSLTSIVPFMDLMGHKTLDSLLVEAWHKWTDSTTPQKANWLRARVGRMSGNKPRNLFFSARRDGVHGMLAGSTGSGKSELLISLIMAMAVTYDPRTLNFVLVDYKGGGAFKEFKDLPHCVDIITNLHSDGVTRMFTAIRAEMERRQLLLTTKGAKDIVDYRRSGFHKDNPFPFLFIIIDEFAEMIADRAEFKSELESITRIGRSLGVSLILAAQRPSGVTDQMRSNIKFRICLRVETPAESREMLRRSEAAFLPGDIPGRGYLQVGNDEIELIQAAYTGDKYMNAQQPAALPPVMWPERRRAQTAEAGRYDAAQEQEPPELYKVIITALNKLAQEHQVDQQRAPWPDSLPAQLALSQRLFAPAGPNQRPITAEEYLKEVDKITLGQPQNKTTLTLNPALTQWLSEEPENGWLEQLDWENYAMRPVVGLVDHPAAAQHLPLVIDLPQGHTVIVGASGWGKTTFMRTLIVSLAATHSPDHLHIYILDLGGRSLGVLADLPHVGAWIIPDEEGYKERVEQLLRELEALIEKRKEIFTTTGAETLYAYNQTHPAEPLPAILVAIDNFVEFRETFGPTSDNTESVLEKFIGLTREAKAYGIHLVTSANQLNDLPSQVYSLFTERLTLKLADPTEYRVIVGGSVPEISGISGRGYMKIGNMPLSVQIARPLETRPGGTEEPANEMTGLKQLAQTMQAVIRTSGRDYREPVRVDPLPKSLLFRQILSEQFQLKLDDEHFLAQLEAQTAQNWADSRQPEKADWLTVTLGKVSGNRLRPLRLEAKADGVHGLIAGGTGSGKSELLMTLIVSLALNYAPDILNFVLVDYKGGGAFEPFKNLPHCVDMITNLNPTATRRVFTAIRAEMERRQKLNAETKTNDIIEYRQQGLHLTHQPYPHLFIIIDEYAEMISENPEFKAELDSITRVGRSIGVNLLLASQKPTGVTDQMRENIKYRICLRVEGVDTSREMLRRSDAAFLPLGMPGRGYLQVGNEAIELIQVAYSGETYEPGASGDKKPKFYELVVAFTQELLQNARPSAPWPPFLPPYLTLSDPLLQGYLPKEYLPLISMGQPGFSTALNPFIREWLDGRTTWPGVDWSKTAMRAIVGLVDDPYNAGQLPLVVDLPRGHAVLFGASGWGKTTFMRALITSLAATHSPDEFQAHILDLGGRTLDVLRALPHVGSIIMPDERGYEEMVQQLLRELNDLVDRRKRLFSETDATTLYEYNHKNEQKKIEPAILVVVDNFTEFIETFGDTGTRDKDNEANLLEAFVALARQAKNYGLHFVISVNRLNALSSKLYSLFTERLTLHLADTGDYHAIVGGSMTEPAAIAGRGYVKAPKKEGDSSSINRPPLEFQAAVAGGEFTEQGQLHGEAQQIRRLGEQMEKPGATAWSGQKPLRLEALPTSSDYRQVLAKEFGLSQEHPFLDQLTTAVRHRWSQTASAEHADWLEVVLGITSGERHRRLRFTAKADGVHGLIAGGTGSGKSELLMTMIVGLALNYSPDILNFVLVDFKGGGAFKPFEKLPHCVDLVTNLNKAAVQRMFTSIRAEMNRRQNLNAQTETKDIIEYRKKGLHLTHQPYPHLFIIIDEYAEMISENPDYRAELESITRVGRSLGVNLILASQRPVGVSDQMRANIKLRLCLRVEQVETSRELLRRPDAAFLPNDVPGRGYLQVGNEAIELIQVAYTGESQPDEREKPVIWSERPPTSTTPTGEDIPKFYDAVVALTSELAGGQRPPRPWSGFLSEKFSLQSPLYNAQKNEWFTLTSAVSNWLNADTPGLWPGVSWSDEALRPVVGLLDDPANARQTFLCFDLTRYHLAVFGEQGWGQTTFLRTLITSLAVTHSPDELHVYILDLGGRNFSSLETLPHVGALICADDEVYEERQMRLLDRLERLVNERQQLLSSAGVSNLLEYNQRYPGQVIPTVLVVIDNVAELKENYELLIENTLIPIVRRSMSVGVSFVMSANMPTNIPGKLYNLLGERITFRQSNPERYLDIVGRGAIEIEGTRGRGYIRQGGRPLLFQIALPVGIFNNEAEDWAEADELRRLAKNMQDILTRGQFIGRNRPDPIKTLPEMIPLRPLLADAGPISPKAVPAVLGQNSSLQPALFDLKRMGPHFAIVGPPLSGKTTTLYNWVLSLAQRYSPAQVGLVLIDLQRKFVEYGGERRLDQLPHVLMTLSEIEQLEGLLTHLKIEGERFEQPGPTRSIFILIDNFDDLADELSNARETKVRDAARDLVRLARQYGTRGLHLIAAGSFSATSDLGRLILASNYGIGLRTVESLNALRVMKIPGNLRGKDLAVGRGFIAKSGELTTIQVATPYHDAGVIPEGADPDESRVTALDQWIQEIMAQYPDQKAAWGDSARSADKADGADPSQLNQSVHEMLSLIQRVMRVETQATSPTDGQKKTITQEFAQLDVANWYDEAKLLELLKRFWITEQNLSDEMAKIMLQDVDTKRLLEGVKNILAHRDGH